ncbi:hypothetical protein A2U01_0071226, partial [Trifolium medium]|nr:hypothetical protein [Trifolium medium]
FPTPIRTRHLDNCSQSYGLRGEHAKSCKILQVNVVVCALSADWCFKRPGALRPLPLAP